MVGDSVNELHDFAAQLGLKRCWFQDKTLYPHYDVTVSVRLKAIALGALPGDKKMIISCAKGMRSELVLERIGGLGLADYRKKGGAVGDLSTGSVQQSLFAAQ
jgi:hypothetical protein